MEVIRRVAQVCTVSVGWVVGEVRSQLRSNKKKRQSVRHSRNQCPISASSTPCSIPQFRLPFL